MSTTTGMIKYLIRSALQKLIGFDNYLFIFSLVTGLRVQHTRYGKELRFFVSLLPEEGTILDIGANIGIITTLLAKKCHQAAVYAFEPVPDNIRALKKIIKVHRFKNVTIFPVALGNGNDTVTMIMPVVKHSKMQGLSHVMEPAEKEQGGKTFVIQMRKMDDMPELQQLSKITAIKIDVENYEYYVLQGGEALLKKHSPVIYCELWNNEQRSKCIAFMKGIGYRIKIYANNRLVDFTGQETINFFFLPENCSYFHR